MKIGRAALHFWEEPCISGERGSGTVFFTGCNLRCVYCQNEVISENRTGREVSEEELLRVFDGLREQGAENINLVTGTHFLPLIARCIARARSSGFDLPFVWNSGGYETTEALRELEGLIDIYLPDMKYWSEEPAARYSLAPDYPERAREAIGEMVRQCPVCRFDERGMMKGGVMVRHLVLPGQVKNAQRILEYLYRSYGNSITISILRQYTPMPRVRERFPELNRRVTRREYDRVADYAIALGIENAFVQEEGTAEESFIPSFGP